MPRIRLNPCDYWILGQHLRLNRRGAGGNIALMELEGTGHVEPERMRRVLRRLITEHPVLSAGLRFCRLWNRPYWQTPGDPAGAAERAVEAVYQFEDLRCTGAQAAEAISLRRRTEGWPWTWDLNQGPMIRLEQEALAGGRTRMRLRWPHALMDAEGALWLWAELQRLSGAGALDEPVPGELPSDDHGFDPLAELSLFRKLALVRRGLSSRPGPGLHKLSVRLHREDRSGELQGYGLLHHWFDGAAWRRIQTMAKNQNAPGVGLYSRHLAACVIRALHQIYTELDIQTEAYWISYPMPVRRPADQTLRAMVGNAIVSPALCGRQAVADDADRLGAELLEQIEAFMAKQGDRGQWAMLWAASAARASMQRMLMALPSGFEGLASGFSYYGEIARPIRRIAGMEVENLWGASPLTSPPGWNPAFCRFADGLNLTLTWNRPMIGAELAGRYFRAIVEQLEL